MLLQKLVRDYSEYTQGESFLFGIAIHSFRATVPTQNTPIEILYGDGVIRVMHYRSRHPKFLVGFQQLGSPLLNPQFQLVTGSAKLFVCAFALADVANHAQSKKPVLRFQRTQHDIYRKLVSVLPPSVQLQSGAHWTLLGLGEKLGPVLRMFFPVEGRHQDLERLAEQLVLAVAKHRLRLGVHERNIPLGVGDDNGVGHEFKVLTTEGLGFSHGGSAMRLSYFPGVSWRHRALAVCSREQKPPPRREGAKEPARNLGPLARIVDQHRDRVNASIKRRHVATSDRNIGTAVAAQQPYGKGSAGGTDTNIHWRLKCCIAIAHQHPET